MSGFSSARSDAAVMITAGTGPSDGGRAHAQPGQSKTSANLGLVDLSGLFRIVRRHLLLLASTLAAALLAAAAYVTLSPAKYTATAVILSDPRQQNVLKSEAVLGGFGADAAAVESQVELIQSPALATRVVDSQNLMNDPEFSRISLSERLMRLVTGNRQAAADSEDEKLRKGKVVASFLKHLYVQRRGLTYIIEVKFTSKDRDKAARIANAVTDAYVKEQQKTKFDATSQAAVWLNEREAQLRDAVRASDQAVADFKANNSVFDVGTIGSGETLIQRQIEEISQQLSTATARTAELKAKLDQAAEVAKAGGNQKAVLSEALGSRVMSDLRVQYAATKRREAQLATTLLPAHPNMRSVRSELKSLDLRINEELTRVIGNATVEYQTALNYQKSLEERLKEKEKLFKEANGLKVKLQELEREQQANRDLYQQIVSRSKETREQEAVQRADARVVSGALPPTRPDGPAAPIILLIGSVVGLSAGLMLSFFAESTDNTYRLRAQIEEDAEAPCLALVPAVSGGALPRKVKAGRKASAGALDAAMASLTLALRRRGGGKGRVILITSALPGAGKTTIAANLARTLADDGQRVLLVSDVSLAAKLNCDGIFEGPGDLPLKEEGKTSGFYVMDRALYYRASAATISDFETVIVDGRSLLGGHGGAADAVTADRVIPVAEWGKTTRAALLRALDALDDDRNKVAGCILNKINQRRLALYDRDYY